MKLVYKQKNPEGVTFLSHLWARYPNGTLGERQTFQINQEEGKPEIDLKSLQIIVDVRKIKLMEYKGRKWEEIPRLDYACDYFNWRPIRIRFHTKKYNHSKIDVEFEGN